MEPFVYRNPTEILFGEGMIREIAPRLPEDAAVLWVYGGGSIRRNGVYEQTRSALAGRRFVEFGGIEPNPEYETCMRAVDLARRERLNFVLATGGGSVLARPSSSPRPRCSRAGTPGRFCAPMANASAARCRSARCSRCRRPAPRRTATP